MRDKYRENNPLPSSPLARGLLCDGEVKEVLVPGNPPTVMPLEAFSLIRAAEALGITRLTLSRWVDDEMVPAPVLLDAVRRYRHYSRGELEVIARELRRHHQEFTYYAKNHVTTTHMIFQAMQGYRESYI